MNKAAEANVDGSHIRKSVCSDIQIRGRAEDIWNNITDVQLEQFSDPFIFKALNIPKPLKAEVGATGEGGSRTAYFSNGKRFLQKITVWKPFAEYAFSFNPEKGFRVGYGFDLSDGVFRMLSGAYYLAPLPNSIRLTLVTHYSLHKRFYFLGKLPVKLVLKMFQKYLLTSIKKNTERNPGRQV